jgi:hypothetical protein
VWDVRTFKPLHAYFANAPATTLDISQKGMLAVGQGRRLQVRCKLAALGARGVGGWVKRGALGLWAGRLRAAPGRRPPAASPLHPCAKPTACPSRRRPIPRAPPQIWRDALAHKAPAPYLTHTLPTGGAACLRFCPFEDVLGAGAAGGYSSVLVPGAGEPNIDSFLANPYASKKERQQAEVIALLDKLQPDTIVLEPDAVGKVRAGRGLGGVGRVGQARTRRGWAGCAGGGRGGRG